MFIKQFTAIAHGPAASVLGHFPIFFFALHLTPVWVAIFSPIYRAFNHRTIEYAITDRRSYIVSGLFGRDVTVVEHRFVQELIVNVGFIENLRGVGTLKLTPDVTTGSERNSRTISGCAMKAIENPYDVYKMLKRISLDVTTDQMFPNAYRPDANPGYNTTLEE